MTNLPTFKVWVKLRVAQAYGLKIIVQHSTDSVLAEADSIHITKMDNDCVSYTEHPAWEIY